MFEKVLAGERRRTRQRTRFALTASVVGHALIAMGAAHVPLGRSGTPRAAVEMVSFVELPMPAARPAAPPSTPPAAAAAPAPAPGDAAASGEATAEQPGEGRVQDLPERLPDVSATLPLPLALSAAPSLELPRFAAARTAGPQTVGAAEGRIVEATVLAERPSLVNRWEMERLWQRLYPRMLELRGIAGEAVIAFVIDEHGRVEPESIDVVSASRPEFADAVLRGVASLRFRPMRVGGLPVRVRTRLPVLWRPLTA